VFDGRPILEVRAERPVETMRILDALPEVEKTSLFGTAVHAVLRGPETTPARIQAQLQAAGLAVTSIQSVLPSLEDVFLDVVERAGQRGAA
jgi:hypothetical protein